MIVDPDNLTIELEELDLLRLGLHKSTDIGQCGHSGCWMLPTNGRVHVLGCTQCTRMFLVPKMEYQEQPIEPLESLEKMIPDDELEAFLNDSENS